MEGEAGRWTKRTSRTRERVASCCCDANVEARHGGRVVAQNWPRHGARAVRVRVRLALQLAPLLAHLCPRGASLEHPHAPPPRPDWAGRVSPAHRPASSPPGADGPRGRTPRECLRAGHHGAPVHHRRRLLPQGPVLPHLRLRLRSAVASEGRRRPPCRDTKPACGRTTHRSPRSSLNVSNNGKSGQNKFSGSCQVVTTFRFTHHCVCPSAFTLIAYTRLHKRAFMW